MANQQGNDILYEMVDIDLLKTKNLQDEKKIIDIIGDVHLARMYNISNSTISDIKSGRTWTNLL